MVYDKYFESDNKFVNVLSKLRNIFSLKNNVFIVLSILLSFQIFLGDYSQLLIALMGVASVLNVPLLFIAIPSGIGLLFSGITQIGIVKVVSIFVIFTIFTAIIKIDGISKRHESLFKLVISTLIVEVIVNFINSTLSANLFVMIESIAFISIFYIIFSTGLNVITNFNKGYVFSSEEKISAIITLSLTLSIFNEFSILNISIVNVIMFIIILIYGYKNGFIYGTAAGVLSGVVLTLVSTIDIFTIILYALTGLISGVFNRFGKISVLVAFVIGNVYILFYTKGMSDITIKLYEMLFSSLIILLIPKKLEKKLEGIFNKNFTLDNPYQNTLDSASNLKEKLNTISSVFEDLSEVKILEDDDERKEFKKIVRRYILDYIECSCLNCEFKKQCKNNDRINLIVDNITNKLINNDEIKEEIFSDLECESSQKLIDGINEVYSNIRIMKILKKKEIENNKKISNQYRQISGILKSISKNLKSSLVVKDQKQQKIRDELKLNGFIVYEDEYRYEEDKFEYTFVTDILVNIEKQKKQIISAIEQIISKKVVIKLILNSSKTEKSKIKVITIPKYEVKSSVLSLKKDGEIVSGDSYLSYELDDRKYVSILSDGMSTGIEANHASKLIINTIEKLLKGGFDVSNSFDILNKIISLREEEGIVSTLDAIIIDTDILEANLIKIGAAPTYILNKDGKITTISSNNLSSGLSLENENSLRITQNLEEDSLIVQLTDGALNIEDDIFENYITEYLKALDIKKSSKIILDELNRLVLKNNKMNLKDDITINVIKIKKN